MPLASSSTSPKGGNCDRARRRRRSQGPQVDLGDAQRAPLAGAQGAHRQGQPEVRPEPSRGGGALHLGRELTRRQPEPVRKLTLLARGSPRSRLTVFEPVSRMENAATNACAAEIKWRNPAP